MQNEEINSKYPWWGKFWHKELKGDPTGEEVLDSCQRQCQIRGSFQCYAIKVQNELQMDYRNLKKILKRLQSKKYIELIIDKQDTRKLVIVCIKNKNE